MSSKQQLEQFKALGNALILMTPIPCVHFTYCKQDYI